MHAKIILAQDVTEYAPLFAEIADAYFEKEMYSEAGHIYEMLGGDAGVWFSLHPMFAIPHRIVRSQTSSMYVLLQAAACRRMVGDLKEAAEVYEHGEPRRSSLECCRILTRFSHTRGSN